MFKSRHHNLTYYKFIFQNIDKVIGTGQNFSIFSLSGQKKSLRVGFKGTQVNGSASVLLRVKSMLGLGWVRTHLYVDRSLNKGFILNSVLYALQHLVVEL